MNGWKTSFIATELALLCVKAFACKVYVNKNKTEIEINLVFIVAVASNYCCNSTFSSIYNHNYETFFSCLSLRGSCSYHCGFSAQHVQSLVGLITWLYMTLICGIFAVLMSRLNIIALYFLAITNSLFRFCFFFFIFLVIEKMGNTHIKVHRQHCI